MSVAVSAAYVRSLPIDGFFRVNGVLHHGQRDKCDECGCETAINVVELTGHGTARIACENLPDRLPELCATDDGGAVCEYCA